MFKKARAILILVLLVWATAASADWISPSGGSGTNWTNVANAYDGNTSTYASDNFSNTGWGAYVTLTLSSTVNCNQLRILADFGQGNVDTCNIDVYNSSTSSWNTVLVGSITDGAWSYVSFNARIISQVRFRYHYTASNLVFWLYEMDVWDAGVPPVAPEVLTKLTTSEDDGGGILHGQVVDDGNETCQFRFEYGLTSAYGTATTWSGQLITDDNFSAQLQGLIIGEYYHYRAELKNSAGTSYGEDRYFWAKQPNKGWISPTGTTDTSNVWENRSYAHDDYLDTYARAFTSVSDTATWSAFMYLSHDAITANAVRFNARIDGLVDQADLDVLSNGVWTDVFQGTTSNKTYVIYVIPTASVSGARIRFHKASNYGMYYELYELDFYKVAEAGKAPAVTLNPVMSILWVDDLYMENGESVRNCVIRRSMNELYLGKIKIDGDAAQVLYTEDYSGIIVTKNEFDLPMMIVPSTNNSFGAWINNHPTKDVLIEFNLERDTRPLVMLGPNSGSALRTITTYGGTVKNGLPAAYLSHVSSYNYRSDLKRLQFYTEQFCTYSIGTVATLNVTPVGAYIPLNAVVTINVVVSGSIGDGVEGAPVTVTITSGSGSLSSTILTTDASGRAVVRYTGPGSATRAVVRLICDNTSVSVTINVGNLVTLEMQPDAKTIPAGTSVTLDISAMDSVGTGIFMVPCTLTMLSGSGTLTTQNFYTDVVGSASVIYTAPYAATQTVLRVTADTKSDTTTIAVSLVYGIDMQPEDQIVTPSNTLTLTINVTANYGGPAVGVPVTINKLAGTGTISTTNTYTDASGNAYVTYTAPSTYTNVQLEAICYNASKINMIYVQSGRIRYVPLGYGGVPSYNTIQAALNACSAGDIVQINYGTYTENLTWPNVSNIMLRGHDEAGSANCIINGNNASQVIYCSNSVTLSVQNVQIRGGRNRLNSPTGRRYGGGITIYNTAGTAALYLYQVLVTNNTATYQANTSRDLGGGIYFYGNNMSLMNCTVASNNARVGGGIYLYQRQLTIGDSVIKKNYTTVGEGGGIYLLDTNATRLAVNDTVFDANDAETDGGAVRLNDTAAISFTNVTFNANLAANGGAVDQGYYAMYDGCAFISNQAGTNGGVFAATSVSLNNCFVSGNKAVAGSGGVLYANTLTRTSTVNNSTFYNNQANLTSGTGGCFRSNDTNYRININRSRFEGNKAYNGGVFNYCTVSDNRSYYKNNSAVFGGGVFYYSLATISNGLFIANDGGSYGGVIYSSVANTFMNCTFVNNDATYGQVLYRITGTPYITNSILYGSSSPFSTSTVPVVTYSRLDGSYTGAGNITTDPQFTDVSGGDYHLYEFSDCVDTGTNTGAPKVDHDGVSRPLNVTTDMGAFETTPAARVSITKNMVVQAPADYVAKGGGSSDVVPGATLIISYTFRNTGKAAADVVDFSDLIPEGTTFVTGSASCSVTAVNTYQHTVGGTFNTSQTLPITAVRWVLSSSLPVNVTRYATMNLTVN